MHPSDNFINFVNQTKPYYVGTNANNEKIQIELLSFNIDQGRAIITPNKVFSKLTNFHESIFCYGFRNIVFKDNLDRNFLKLRVSKDLTKLKILDLLSGNVLSILHIQNDVRVRY